MKRNKFAIILTGTIQPNVKICNKITAVEERRLDYIKAIKFYVKYAPVIFIENSQYDILKDKDFINIKNLYIIKEPLSKYVKRGKGFQEFEMLDKFILSKESPESFLKITGRFLIDNFDEVYNEVKKTDKDMIVDVYLKSKWADTYMFFCKKDTYIKNFLGIYNEMDDTTPEFTCAEKIFFKYIINNKNINYRMFFFESNILGKSGTSGERYPLKSNLRLIRRRLRRKWRYFIQKRRYLR